MTIKTHPTHLTIDDLVANRAVARRLSPTVAFRYHALPIAKDSDHITIAMANPNDEIAYNAIVDSLGMQPYVVKGNQATIDQQLAKIWPDVTQQTPVNILVYHQDSPIAHQIKTYAQQLCVLLEGQLTCFESEESNIGLNDLVEKVGCRQDLVIFGEPDQSLIKRILVGSIGCRAVEQLPTSVLVTRQPRWPLRRILLVTRGYQNDDPAVDWFVRLAQPSQALATVLALTPDSAAIYQHAATTMPRGLADWLASGTPLGHQLRSITQQLKNWEIQGRLHFRQGSPDDQIKQEVTEGDYDLVVIAANPDDWWQRRLLGELVNPLLHCANQPVLVAKYIKA